MIYSIYGRNRSGKTTLARMFVDNGFCVSISFADPLRKLVADYFGINVTWKTDESWVVNSEYRQAVDRLRSIVNPAYRDMFDPVLNKINDATTKYDAYRITMELVGTEVVRSMIFDGTWTGIAAQAILKFASRGQDVVIDDMRFCDEYCMLKGFDTTMILITSPSQEPDNGHRSQSYIDSFVPDCIVDNNGTLKKLNLEYENIMGDML